MSTAKEIRARIKSVKNTRKITRAMELISTVKMKKAQDSVRATRPFALATFDIFRRAGDTIPRIFGEERTVRHRELVVLIASNKGLCGGYNVNAFKALHRHVRSRPDATFAYVTIGKRARDFVMRSGGVIVDDFSDRIRDSVTLAEVRQISRALLGYYTSGEYDSVTVVFNYYVSALTQKAIAKTFLPISRDDIEEYFRETLGRDVEHLASPTNIEYGIEPDEETILRETIPLLLDAILYEKLLESKASEHAARMVAMKNAKDSATKKVSALTLSYNKARQASITKEVSEIVSGVESMKDTV